MGHLNKSSALWDTGLLFIYSYVLYESKQAYRCINKQTNKQTNKLFYQRKEKWEKWVVMSIQQYNKDSNVQYII